MRNIAKLSLLFSLSFLIIFLAAAGFRFLSLRVDWAKNLPARPETFLTMIISAAQWALSFALFSSILFSLNYAARRKYFALMTVICIMILSVSFCFGFSFLLDNWKSVPPAQSTGIQLGDKGLLLSNALNRNETTVVLLEGTANPYGPRVVSIPDQSLLFYETAGAGFDLPPVPFSDDTPWFLKSLFIDIRLNAEVLQQNFAAGYIPFLIYAGSLIFLLCSLGFAIKISVWPLANLFIGILAFRGILAFETFLNSREMREVLGSFLGSMIPAAGSLNSNALVVPFIFLGLGALIHLYSVLVFAARKRSEDDD